MFNFLSSPGRGGQGRLQHFHGSYDFSRNAAQLLRETENLRRVMGEEGIEQDLAGGRLHYLHFAMPVTTTLLQAAGLSYDSSLGYADRAGFRCGTCHENPMFDPVGHCPLSLRQRPLVGMDCTVVAEPYMGLGFSEQTLNHMKLLRSRCQRYRGNFTLLWHNSFLRGDAARELYLEMIK